MLGKNATHANFSVNDLQKAKDFYVDKLGLKVIKENDQEILFESEAGTRVNIYYKPDHMAWDSTIFGIEVSDVHEAAKELTDKGIEVAHMEGSDEMGVLHDSDSGEEVAW